MGAIREIIGPELTERHFNPKYRPWRQRLAFLPESDLFHAIRAGKVSIETDEIERFSEEGLLLKSGKALPADIVATATGFNLCVMGDIEFKVDGKPVNFAETVTYRGMMFTGVPNLVYVFGYLRASWTLRVDLVADFVCRLLSHMKARNLAKVEVALTPADAALPKLPWIDPENFNPGYLMRSVHLLPRRLDKAEWQHSQDYHLDKKNFPLINLDAPEFVYREACGPAIPVSVRRGIHA
jgi:cation diffusion facilitator CzcD-associated flavoprotein CzcO